MTPKLPALPPFKSGRHVSYIVQEASATYFLIRIDIHHAKAALDAAAEKKLIKEGDYAVVSSRIRVVLEPKGSLDKFKELASFLEGYITCQIGY